MNPPTCRFCKKSEWNHTCAGAAAPKLAETIQKITSKKSTKKGKKK